MHVIDLHCYPFGDQYAALDVERLVREGRNSAQREMRQNGHASKRAVFGSGEKGLTRTGDLHRGE